VIGADGRPHRWTIRTIARCSRRSSAPHLCPSGATSVCRRGDWADGAWVSYRFTHMQRAVRALTSSSKTSLRIDDEGLLSLQFLMPAPRARVAAGPGAGAGPVSATSEAFIELRVRASRIDTAGTLMIRRSVCRWTKTCKASGRRVVGGDRRRCRGYELKVWGRLCHSAMPAGVYGLLASNGTACHVCTGLG
jgi:hypothetical protein